jgi:SAM-dependent methyltransferase
MTRPTGNHISERDVLKRLQYHWNSLKSLGPHYPLWLIRKVMSGRQRNREILSKFGGRGLEIGGPSRFFQSEFPIYSAAENVDNVNFNRATFWEGTLTEGQNFNYYPQKKAGYQFIREASDLSAIADGAYDFVASCHTLEHCANPIKALIEWRRVLRNDGWLALVLPHKAATFDRHREVTTFEHLLEDYRRDTAENDSTHFAEILEKHDLKLDPAQESKASFEKWIRENSINRGAHHHVFEPELAARLVDHGGFEMAAAEVCMPFHIFIVAQKSSNSQPEKEKRLLPILQGCCARSPFKSDRQKQHLKFSLAGAVQSRFRGYPIADLIVQGRI